MNLTKQQFEPDIGARQKIIGVMGSGTEPHEELAGIVGRIIAQAGHHLLTGGGEGVMTSVSAAFAAVEDRRGKVIGVLRADGGAHLGPKLKRRDYSPLKPPNRYVEIPIYTHLPFSGEEGKLDLSRNHINVLTSDAIVALPGGAGTLSEVELASEYGWPVVLFLGDGQIGKYTAEKLAARHSQTVSVAQDENALREKLAELLT